jgi:hypothetical protein
MLWLEETRLANSWPMCSFEGFYFYVPTSYFLSNGRENARKIFFFSHGGCGKAGRFATSKKRVFFSTDFELRFFLH